MLGGCFSERRGETRSPGVIHNRGSYMPRREAGGLRGVARCHVCTNFAVTREMNDPLMMLAEREEDRLRI
jgi:hypothetical protein